MLQSRLNTAIDCEFSYWEKHGPIVLRLPGEESEVLLDFFVYLFSLPIHLRVVHGRKLAIDTELLVQSFDESGCELRSSVTDDASGEAVKLEHIANVKVCDTFYVDLIRGKSKMCLFYVQIDVHSDGCVRFPVDSFTRWQSGDKVGANDLPRSFRDSDWKCSRFRMRNQLETLTLLAASNILVNEGVYEWPPVVLFDEFQGEVAAWMSCCN